MKTILLVAAATLVAFATPVMAGDIVIAHPLHAELIVPAPAMAAYADASRLVATTKTGSPSAAKQRTITIARPLHAQLIAPAPAMAAYADVARMRVRDDAEVALAHK